MAFAKGKLEHVSIASMESYLFKYDFAQTRSLQDEYKIGAVHTNSFVESFTEGREIVDLFGKTIYGFRVDSLSIYQNYKEIGEYQLRKTLLKYIKYLKT